MKKNSAYTWPTSLDSGILLIVPDTSGQTYFQREGREMTAVYVAARFDTRQRLLKEVMQPLHEAGHAVTSRWLLAASDEPVLDADDLAKNVSAGVAPGIECLDDIKRADVVVVLTGAPSSTGGYALGLGKRIEVVGPPLNVFHALPCVTRHATVADFLKVWGYPSAQ